MPHSNASQRTPRSHATESTTRQVEATLASAKIHDQWRGAFRTQENEAFFELAFTHIAQQLSRLDCRTVLDAGCGDGTHAVRLARHGFRVTAADLAADVVEQADQRVRRLGMEDRIKVCRENLRELSFSDQSFDAVVCWGVLMHIPDFSTALDELTRVMRSGGLLVLSEINSNSCQAILARCLNRRPAQRSGTGWEYWSESAGGRMLTRHTNGAWLQTWAQKQGLNLIDRRAGQFTELYSGLDSRWWRDCVQAFNRIWFRYVYLPGPAFGNIWVFRKQA